LVTDPLETDRWPDGFPKRIFIFKQLKSWSNSLLFVLTKYNLYIAYKR
jgi:hypothetical protein